jgi:hypothetical protein
MNLETNANTNTAQSMEPHKVTLETERRARRNLIDLAINAAISGNILNIDLDATRTSIRSKMCRKHGFKYEFDAGGYSCIGNASLMRPDQLFIFVIAANLPRRNGSTRAEIVLQADAFIRLGTTGYFDVEASTAQGNVNPGNLRATPEAVSRFAELTIPLNGFCLNWA